MKSNRIKQIIMEQINYLADEVVMSSVHLSKDYEYFIIPEFPFPKIWHSTPGIINGKAQILICLGDNFPLDPPTGFYIHKSVISSPNGHFLDTAMHGAPKKFTDSGYWRWYCAFIKPGAWQPAVYTRPNSWLDGDNLFTFYAVIQEVLSSKD